MDRQILIYLYAALLTLVGLLCLFAAFRKMTAKEKMTKTLERPLIKNYGNPFLWLFGLLCIILAIQLLFKTTK
jgi:amino acid permease